MSTRRPSRRNARLERMEGKSRGYLSKLTRWWCWWTILCILDFTPDRPVHFSTNSTFLGRFNKIVITERRLFIQIFQLLSRARSSFIQLSQLRHVITKFLEHRNGTKRIWTQVPLLRIWRSMADLPCGNVSPSLVKVLFLVEILFFLRRF